MDNRNCVYNGFKHTFQKLVALTISFCLALFPAIVLAASTPEDIWLREITKNVDSTGRTTGYTVDASKRTIVNGSARDMSSKLLDYKPQRSAVSGVMKKRLTQAAVGGGVGLIGVAAVDALLRGIGWIMEDGAYVKVRQPDGSIDPNNPPPDQEFLYCEWRYGCPKESYAYVTPESAGQATCKSYNETFIKVRPFTPSNGAYGLVDCKKTDGSLDQWNIKTKSNSAYDPTKPPTSQQPTKTPITDQELQDIMFGDYAGDPSTNIQPKNDGTHTGVQETMTADPNAGEGTKDKPSNPVTEDLDQKLDANPNKTTKDYNSTDSKGDEETTNADGTKENTITQTKTELPAFCNYAAALCKWMDWTQEEPTDQEEDFNIDKEELEIPAIVDTSRVQFGNQCPADMSGSYSLLGRSHSFSYSFDALCTVAVNLKPAVIGCSSIAAAYIMLGISRKGEE